MLLKNRIDTWTGSYPNLSRVWIRSGDPKTPLKGVWIAESRLHRLAEEACASPRESETVDLADDHLLLVA